MSTRTVATITAKKCKLLRLHGVSIDILEEIGALEITPHKLALQSPQKTQITVEDHFKSLENEFIQQHPPYAAPMVSMLDCVTILNCVASPAINRRLQNWRYFDGDGHQVMTKIFTIG